MHAFVHESVFLIRWLSLETQNVHVSDKQEEKGQRESITSLEGT